MVSDKEAKLVDQLLEKTRKRRLAWEPTAKEDEFVSSLRGNVSFTVGEWHERTMLVMRDDMGRVLVTVDSYDAPKLAELYTEVRRQALRVDESLDDVLNELGRME